jgi:UDP-glucose 4-epimerase
LAFVRGLAVILEKTYGFLDKTPALNREKLNELTAVNWCCDIEKARINLDFRPQFNLQQGLKEALEWYRQNKWL